MEKETIKKEDQEPKTTLKTVLLQELGSRLPLGIQDSAGGFNNSLALRRWTMKQEKELGELRKENKGANMGEYVSMVLSSMCSRIGPYDFENMKFEERRVRISQMWMGDVFAAYCLLRKKALGKILGMDTSCPFCDKAEDFNADLDTIEVTTAENLEDLQWDYKLLEPFDIRGKKVTGFTLGPARWNSMETIADEGGSMGHAKAGLICGSVFKVHGHDTPLALVSHELDEMGKHDIELLSKKLEDEPLGPNMSIEKRCQKCRKDMKLPIRWSYDDFFGTSSR